MKLLESLRGEVCRRLVLGQLVNFEVKRESKR